MAAVSRFTKGNRLLQTLSAAERGLLEPNFISVSLKLRRNVIFEKHRAELEALYRDAGTGPMS